MSFGTLAVALAALPANARDAFSSYGAPYRAVTLPQIGQGSFDIKGDALPDGRIIAVTGASVFLERGVGSRLFDAVASLDLGLIGGGTDPAFLTVSPNGSTIAIGAGFGRPVVTFPTAALGTPSMPSTIAAGVGHAFAVPHFDAAWADDTHLAITAGDFGSPSFVSLLDTTSNPGSPVNPTIISNIDGASAGIAFDAAGRLYTGNGFDLNMSSGTNTGTIKAFDPSSWAMHPADFVGDGFLIGEVLSASSLNFDLEGNLFVGGADVPDIGFLGIVHASAIADAIAGLGPINPSDPLDLRRINPLLIESHYYGSAFNPFTHELYVTDGRDWFATVPSPGPGSVVILAGGVALLRRRRRADA